MTRIPVVLDNKVLHLNPLDSSPPEFDSELRLSPQLLIASLFTRTYNFDVYSHCLLRVASTSSPPGPTPFAPRLTLN